MSWVKLVQKCPLIWLTVQKKALLICIPSAVVVALRNTSSGKKNKIESLVLTLRLSAQFRLDKKGGGDFPRESVSIC